MADSESVEKNEEKKEETKEETKEEKVVEERRPSRTRKAPTKYSSVKMIDSEDEEEEEEAEEDDDSDDDPSWGAVKQKDDSDDDSRKKKDDSDAEEETSGKKKGGRNNFTPNKVKAPSVPYKGNTQVGTPMNYQNQMQRPGQSYPYMQNTPQTPPRYGNNNYPAGYNMINTSPYPSAPQTNPQAPQAPSYARWKQQSTALMSQLKKQSSQLLSAENNVLQVKTKLDELSRTITIQRLVLHANDAVLLKAETDLTYQKTLMMHSQNTVQVNLLQLRILQQQLTMMNKGIAQIPMTPIQSPPSNVNLYNPNAGYNMDPANFQNQLQNMRQHHINAAENSPQFSMLKPNAQYANQTPQGYGERMLSHQRLLQQQNVLMREAAQPQAMTQQEIQQRDQLRSMSLFNNDFKNQQRMTSASSWSKVPGSSPYAQLASQQPPKPRKFVRASLNSDEEEDEMFSDEDEDDLEEADQDRKLLLGITKQCENYSNKMRKVLSQWHAKSNARKLESGSDPSKPVAEETNNYGQLIPKKTAPEAASTADIKEEKKELQGEDVKKETEEEKKAEGEGEEKKEEVKKEGEEEKKDELADLDLITQPENLKYELRPYQLIGLNWLYLLFQQKINGILADEMGLGKTIQTIALFSLLAQRGEVTKPHVVIAPSTALENWVREFSVWCPSLRVVMYHGTAKDRETLRKQLVPKTGEKLPFDVLITTYNICINKVDRVKLFKKIKFSFIVLDEAHNVKNVGSSRYKNLLKLAFRAENRLMLTGTPLQNNINELWTLLSFLMPTIFSKNKDFTTLVWEEEKEEEEEKQAQLQDPNNPEEISRDNKTGPTVKEKQSLNDRLRTQNSKIVERLKIILSPFVLRRLKSEVLGKLPPKTEKIKWCELVSGQKEMYDRMLQYSKSKYNELNQSKTKEESKPKDASEAPVEEKEQEISKEQKEKEEMIQEEKELKKDAESIIAPPSDESSKKEKPTLNHILMQLRKAANNVLFFRNVYDEDKLRAIEKLLEEERRNEEEKRAEEEQKELKALEEQPFQTVEDTKKKKAVAKKAKKPKKKEQKQAKEEEEEKEEIPEEENEKMEESTEITETKMEENEVENEGIEDPLSVNPNLPEPSPEDICGLCGESGDLIICDGSCKRAFHPLCVEIESTDQLPDEWYCEECAAGGLPPDSEQPYKTQVNEILDVVQNLVANGRLASHLFVWLPCREVYPDYYEIIRKPVSLNSMRRTPWTSVPKFRDAFFQMIKNAKTYNEPSSPVYKDALALEKCFLAEFAKHFPHLKAQTAKGSGKSGTPAKRKSSGASTPSKRSKKAENGSDDDDAEDETPKKKKPTSTPKSSSKKSRATNNSNSLEDSFGLDDTPRRSSRAKKTRTNEADLDDNSDIDSYLEARNASKLRSISNRSQGSRVKLREPFIECKRLLEDLMDQDGAEPFLEPVDYKALDLDDYLDIVKEPMDLGSVYEKLTGGKYQTTDEFVADVRKVFDNCLMYNESCSTIGIAASNLWSYFKLQCRKADPKIEVIDIGKLGASRRANISIYEELSQKSDFQIGSICQQHECLKEFRLSDDQILTSSGKLVQMKKTLSNCHGRGDRVIIFSQFTAVLDILEEFLGRLNYQFVRLDGQTPVLERQVIIDRFNSDRTIFVFLLSTRAGGIGINLTSANVCIFHDIDWNPEMDRQAEARIHRIGQTRPVKIVKLLSKQSVDEYIYAMSQNKKERNDVVMGNTEGKAGDAGTPDEKLAIGKVLAALFGQ